MKLKCPECGNIGISVFGKLKSVKKKPVVCVSCGAKFNHNAHIVSALVGLVSLLILPFSLVFIDSYNLMMDFFSVNSFFFGDFFIIVLLIAYAFVYSVVLFLPLHKID